MIKFWVSCIPLSLGLIFSLACTLFMITFTRSIELDFEYFRFHPEAITSLVLAFVCGFIGVPLTVLGIKKIESID